ncbi:MAG: NAD-dependent epimerase/dehydratase family protein [Solirubrobacteraceae bacterium]
MSGRTLVTGATGFIGSHVAKLLVERGDDVLATVRPRSRTHQLDALGVETVGADICDRRAIRRAMKGADRVFHIAGSSSLRQPRDLLFSVNVEGARVVLEEALRAGVERAVLTSSIAAIGPAPSGEIADERSVWDAGRYRIAYIDSKHGAEVLAMQLRSRGLPLVIVNPAHTMGPGDSGRSSTVLVQRFLRRQIPAYVDGTLNIVGVEDVARGHLLADERGIVGERYILGNRNFTLDRLFVDLGRLSGVEPPALKLPVAVAMSLSIAAQRLPGLGFPPPAEVRAASLNWALSNAKAKRELGWSTSAHEACLEETVAWYREREDVELSGAAARQPFAWRLAGGLARRIPRVL